MYKSRLPYYLLFPLSKLANVHMLLTQNSQINCSQTLSKHFDKHRGSTWESDTCRPQG